MKNNGYQRIKEVAFQAFIACATFILVMFIAILMTILSSCATHRPATPTLQSARTDTVLKVILRVDSIRVTEHTSTKVLRHDSIAPILDHHGNITGWDRFHSTHVTNDNSREIARLNSVIDSLRSIRADTVFIRQPPPEPVITNILTPWQSFRVRAFWFLIIALAASLIYIFRRPLLRLLCRLRL